MVNKLDLITWYCCECQQKISPLFKDEWECLVCDKCGADDIGPTLTGRHADTAVIDCWIENSHGRYFNEEGFFESCRDMVLDSDDRTLSYIYTILDECMELVKNKTAEMELDYQLCFLKE